MIARRTAGLAAVLLAAAACTPAQRDKVDSAAGVAESVSRTVLSVIDVDMGRHADSAKKISDKTDTFAPNDTIYASVHTSGTASPGMLVGRWTFPDGSTIDQNAENATSEGYLAFFVTKPGGLATGKYTFKVIMDGREVRSKDVTVK